MKECRVSDLVVSLCPHDRVTAQRVVWNIRHESSPSAVRSRVRARQTGISIKAKQTRISSLLASQGPLLGYVCNTPQIFIMTDLRKTDTTEFRRRLRVPRRKRASPLCRCSRYEASQESSV